jgi:hypothetical protein
VTVATVATIVAVWRRHQVKRRREKIKPALLRLDGFLETNAFTTLSAFVLFEKGMAFVLGGLSKKNYHWLDL